MTTNPYGQYASPYVGMGNKPVNGVDPDGGFWQEFKNWISHGMWISNAGYNFLRNTPNATYHGWEGNRLKGGHAKVSWSENDLNTRDSKLATVGIASFGAVQDYTFNGMDVYFDFTLNVTAGLRAASLIKGLEGFDVNIASTSLVSYSWAEDEWKSIWKNQTEYSTGLALAHAGMGAEVGTSFSYNNGKIDDVKMKISGALGGVSVEVAYDLANKKLDGALKGSLVGGVLIVGEISGGLVIKQHNAFHK